MDITAQCAYLFRIKSCHFVVSIGKYSGKGIVSWLWATFAVHTRDGHHLSDNGDHHRIWHGKEENISKGVLFCDLTMTTSFDTVLRPAVTETRKHKTCPSLQKHDNDMDLGDSTMVSYTCPFSKRRAKSHRTPQHAPGQFVTHQANNAKSQFDHFLYNLSFARRTI